MLGGRGLRVEGLSEFQASNGRKYAAYRKNGDNAKTWHYLGKVMEEDVGDVLYFRRDLGFFNFSHCGGIVPVEDLVVPDRSLRLVGRKNLRGFTFCFGDIFVIYKYLEALGWIDVFKAAYPREADSVLNLVFYNIINKGYTCESVSEWNSYSFIRVLFPKAAVEPEDISAFLSRLGRAQYFENFASKYIERVSQTTGREGERLITDSKKLQDLMKAGFASIHSDLAKGEEICFSTAYDCISGIPIYFKLGSVTEKELDLLSGCVSDMYDLRLDAGVMTPGAVESLVKSDIPFFIRLPAYGEAYKKLLKGYSFGKQVIDRMHVFNERIIQAEKLEPGSSDGSEVLTTYAVQNQSAQSDEMGDLISAYRDAEDEEYPPDATDEQIEAIDAEFAEYEERMNYEFKRLGVFIGQSNIDELEAIIPFVFNAQDRDHMLRQFDPKESSLQTRGRFLIAVMVSIAYNSLMKKLGDVYPMIKSLNDCYCHYTEEDSVFLDEPLTEFAKIAKKLGVELPTERGGYSLKKLMSSKVKI
jgi:hypothetical protein